MTDVVQNDYGHFVADDVLRFAGYFKTEEQGVKNFMDAAKAKSDGYAFVRKIVEPCERNGLGKVRVEVHFVKRPA